MIQKTICIFPQSCIILILKSISGQDEICLVSGEPGTFWDLEPEFSSEYEDEASLINQIV